MDAVYQVQADRAFGFSRATRAWETIDISRALNLLVNDYHTFEVGLESLTREYTFFSQYHLADLQNRTDTLQDWLNTMPGKTIPTLATGYPVLEFDYAHYQNLYADLEPRTYLCPPNYHYTQEFSLDDATDVLIVVEDKYRDKYRNNVLYNVDGQWVSHQSDPDGVRLTGAGKIVRRSGSPSMGCLVFNDLGNVTTYPMSGLTISKLDPTMDYYSRLMVSLPVSVTGKTVGFVIGGILHWLPSQNYFSDQAIMLSLSNLSMYKTVLETRGHYDWDDIGLGDLSTATSVLKILSSETLLAMLKHESSFIVVVDNPYVERIEVPLNQTASYGRFYLRDPNDIYSKLPLGPLFNEFGKCVNFWPIWEEGEWTFHTNELDRQNTVATHARWKQQSVVNDAIPIVSDPYRDTVAIMHRFKARKK